MARVPGGAGSVDAAGGSGRRARGRRRVIVEIIVLVTLLGTGVTLLIIGIRPDPSAATPVAAPVPTQDYVVPTVRDPVSQALQSTRAADPGPDDGTVRQPDHSRVPGTAPPDQEPDDPVRDDHLVIPVLGIDAAVSRTALDDDRSLILPDEVNRVTEWNGSAGITEKRGTVLVAGHVDAADQGTGALYWIHTLQPGDAVYLARRGVVTRWKVTGMQTLLKAALPESIWAGATGPRQLVLVTCGGELVRDSQGRGNYTDNVVVTAVPF